MKRLAILLCVSFLGCTSASDRAKSKLQAPEMSLVQLIGPADMNYPAGRIEVKFGLHVTNRSPAPITLRQVQVEPVGSGGPYELTRATYYFREAIAPAQSAEVTFWARASASGDPTANDASAPIMVRATALFQGPDGWLRKVIIERFAQR